MPRPHSYQQKIHRPYRINGPLWVLCHFIFTKQRKMQIYHYFHQWIQHENAVSFLFLSLLNVLGMASHYMVTRYIESTLLGLSNSWYTITSITSNTHIDYWSQDRPINPCCWCSVWDGEGKVNGDEDTRRWSINRSRILFCSRKLCSDYLKMVGVNKYATLKT